LQLCARDERGGVTCVELGTAPETQWLPDPRQIRKVDVTVRSLVATGTEICGLDGPTDVVCWKARGGPLRDSTTPPEVARCRLLDDRTVSCAAPGDVGVRLAGVGGVSALWSSEGVTCVRQANGWHCWDPEPASDAGRRHAGGPLRIAGVPAFVQASLGRLGLCGVDAAHRLTCFRPVADLATPWKLVPWFELPSARSVAVGGDHGCVIRDDESLWCFGANESKEVEARYSEPWIDAPVAVTEHVRDVAIGRRHTCAADTAGKVRCWGDDALGQVGRLAVLPRPALRVAAGDGHSCALLDDGGVYCWGGNGFGQLGVAPSPPKEPVRVPLPGPATAIASAGNTSCALLDAGRLACWGKPYPCEAQETCSTSASPTLIPSREPASAVALGPRHACALSSSGRVACVGSNDYGALGAIFPIHRVVHENHHAESCDTVEWAEQPGSADFVEVAW
ncbi:MAG TPA: hypothetical protein VGQ57_09900, partial [Polyangiaceae bacterium]|nr:hypothetical protein [Polyangiaceae bacterium]